MMRLQAVLPTSGLSALAAHSSRSAGVAASAGIASRRPTQRSSPPDPRAAMLFPLLPSLRRDADRRDDFSINAGHSVISTRTVIRARPPLDAVRRASRIDRLRYGPSPTAASTSPARRHLASQRRNNVTTDKSAERNGSSVFLWPLGGAHD